MNWLDKIIADKSAEIALARQREKELRARAEMRTDFRDFSSAIRRARGPLKIIAETKQASPSAGKLTRNYDPGLQAHRYQANGANAISVLTETNYFLGSLEHLRAAREAAELPVLRKDFIVDEAQIVESAARHADAILLIVAALVPKKLDSLHRCARALKMTALVEVHTAEEIQIALDAGVGIIGINNRDLSTLEIDLARTESLVPHIPPGITIVSESGIQGVDEIMKMSRLPIDALLIGEAFMRADAKTLAQLFGQI